MLFIFGRSLSKNLSRYFVQRAEGDGHQALFASMGQFASSEAFCELKNISKEQLAGRPVVVMESFARVGGLTANDFFTNTLILGDTLKRYGAGPLWLINPFGPYARQDQERPGKLDSVVCEASARHLALDFKGISCVELHSLKARQLMEKHLGEGNVISIDPTEIFVVDLAQFKLQNPVIVSPDKGANARADALAELLCAGRCYVDKERKEIIHTRVVDFRGDVAGRDVVMVDDMADTFGTAENSARIVREKGARRVFFYAAHPVLSPPAWDRIAKLLSDGVIDHVRFGDTIARAAEYESFAQQYGPDIASKIGFVDMGDILYRHAMQDIANHPAMQPAI